jgi:hypothetical protein
MHIESDDTGRDTPDSAPNENRTAGGHGPNRVNRPGLIDDSYYAYDEQPVSRETIDRAIRSASTWPRRALRRHSAAVMTVSVALMCVLACVIVLAGSAILAWVEQNALQLLEIGAATGIAIVAVSALFWYRRIL